MKLQERIDAFLARGPAADVYAGAVSHYYVRYLETLGLRETTFVDHTEHHLVEAGGRRVLDLVAGYGTCHWGRAREIRDAVRQAAELRLPGLVQFTAPVLASMVAEELLAYAGEDFDRVFFTNGGAESVDYALKMARNVTGRTRAVCFAAGYHGLTLGALAVNGAVEHQRMFGLEGESLVLPFNDAQALEDAFRTHGRELAAVVVEPVVARTGEVATPRFLERARALCDRWGALLVLDEVKTGFGRTGRPFFHRWSGVVPDVMTVAKGLSGGMVPVGAVLYGERVYRKVFSSVERIAVYSSTFKENNLSMAAALAVLDLFRRRPWIYDHVLEAEARLRDRLEAAGGDTFGFRVGGRGLLLTVEVVPRRGKRWMHRLMDRVEGDMFYGMLARDLYEAEAILVSLPNRFGARLALIPALDLPHEELDAFADALARSTGRLLERSNWGLIKDVVADARTVL
jgi:ornithine--oxo-acid transaminase